MLCRRYTHNADTHCSYNGRTEREFAPNRHRPCRAGETLRRIARPNPYRQGEIQQDLASLDAVSAKLTYRIDAIRPRYRRLQPLGLAPTPGHRGLANTSRQPSRLGGSRCPARGFFFFVEVSFNSDRYQFKQLYQFVRNFRVRDGLGSMPEKCQGCSEGMLF